jgi:hypothetical protein
MTVQGLEKFPTDASSHDTGHIATEAERIRRRWHGRRGAERSLGRTVVRSIRKVDILDWNEGKSITVSWRDPTSCRYGAQIWIFGKARRGGLCAKSGRQITMGDAIYRPRVRGISLPRNAGEMILASIVSEISVVERALR